MKKYLKRARSGEGDKDTNSSKAQKLFESRILGEEGYHTYDSYVIISFDPSLITCV